MTSLKLFSALLVTGLAGFGAAALVLPRHGARATEFAGLAVIFGGAIVSLLLFLFGFVFPQPFLQLAIAASAIALTVLGAIRQRENLVCPRMPPTCAWQIILVALMFAQIAIIAWQSIVQPFRWDGLFSWEIKAHIAFENGGAMPISYYADASRVWSHHHYPLGVPLMEDWLYIWIGAAHQGFAKVPGPFIYVGAIALLYSACLKLSHGDRVRALISATLPFFVPCLVIGPGSASSGWADFPLALAYLGAVLYLADFAENGARDSLRMFGSCAAVLPWLKQEGIILDGCLFLIAIVLAWPRKKVGLVLRACLPAVVVFVGWKLFLALARTPPSDDFLPFNAVTFLSNWSRLGVGAKFVAGEIINFDRWGLLWIATLIALVDLALRHRARQTLLFAFAIFLPIVLYGGIYVFSAWPNFRAHMSTSLPRLMMDSALVALLTIGLALPLPRRAEIIPERA